MPNEHQKLQRNIRLLYVINFFNSSMFILPIYILFGTQYLGLNYLQAGSFFLVNLFVSISLDFLGGVMADRVGRKQTFMLGMALQVVTYIPFLFTKSYLILLFFAAVNGVGIALASNSVDALIYEEANRADEKKAYQHANANVSIFEYFGRIIASVIGGFAYNIDPRFPYAMYILALVLALIAGANLLVNNNYNQGQKPHYYKLLKTAFRTYSNNLLLLKFVAVGCAFAIFADMLFFFYQPFFIEQNVSSSLLGVLIAAISLFSAFGSYLMRKLPDKISATAIQTVELMGVIATGLLLVVLNIPLAFVAPLIMGLISGFMYPNMRLFVNNNTTNNVRASVLSLATTMFSIGTALGLVFSLYLADQIEPNSILIIIIAGSILTLFANIFIKVPKKLVTRAN